MANTVYQIACRFGPCAIALRVRTARHTFSSEDDAVSHEESVGTIIAVSRLFFGGFRRAFVSRIQLTERYDHVVCVPYLTDGPRTKIILAHAYVTLMRRARHLPGTIEKVRTAAVFVCFSARRVTTVFVDINRFTV